MIDKEMKQFEEQLQKDLHQFLLSMKEVDERLPEPTVDGRRVSQCPDVEEKWEEIAQAYTPDGIREFNDFPSASLGWMMYIGMAVAEFWDAEWEVMEQREQSQDCLNSAESRQNSTEGQIYSKIEDGGEHQPSLYAYLRDKRGYDRPYS